MRRLIHGFANKAGAKEGWLMQVRGMKHGLICLHQPKRHTGTVCNQHLIIKVVYIYRERRERHISDQLRFMLAPSTAVRIKYASQMGHVAYRLHQRAHWHKLEARPFLFLFISDMNPAPEPLDSNNALQPLSTCEPCALRSSRRRTINSQWRSNICQGAVLVPVRLSYCFI